MKLIISIPTFLTVLVVAIVIALPPLSPIPVSALSDESETNAEQRLGQKNLGSGESDNFNCDENMITSASGVDCIPSGPAPPTPPPPPPTVITIITGNAVGTISCEGEEEANAGLGFFADVAEDGTVTGSVNIEIVAIVTLAVSGGTTDGNTFSLSGESGFCSEEPFTITGDCGVEGFVSYEDPNGIGNFGSADVLCTPV